MVKAQNSNDTTYSFENDSVHFAGSGEIVMLPDSVWRPIPKKATMLSAAFPGAGQIYNRQWWKAPIIYAGFVTLGYTVYWHNETYISYRNAYVDFIDDDPTTTRYEELFAEGTTADDFDDDYLEETFEDRKDSYRRDRDFYIICTLGLYVLNIIEANVAAHLYDFDVSDDLSMRIRPDVNYDFVADKPYVGLSLCFNMN